MAHMTFTLTDKDGVTSSTFLLKEEDVSRIHEALCNVYQKEDTSYDNIFSTLFTNLMFSVLNTVKTEEANKKYNEYLASVVPISLEKQ